MKPTMEFEKPEAAQWGSVRLERAVVDYVADLGRGLNAFVGFQSARCVRRFAILGGVVLVATIIGFAMPNYTRIFFNRLCLGSQRYPTQTKIVAVEVNGRVGVRVHLSEPLNDAMKQELSRLGFRAQRSDAKQKTSPKVQVGTIKTTRLQALKKLNGVESIERVSNPTFYIGYGKKVRFVASCKGYTPGGEESGSIKFHSRDTGKSQGEVVMEPAPEYASEEGGTAFQGTLPRLIESISYKVYLGDTWTESANVTIIPRAVVEPRLRSTAPEYARYNETEEPQWLSEPQQTVLEGSSVELEIDSDKPLKSASVTVVDARGVGYSKRTYQLQPMNKERDRWGLVDKDSPFAKATHSIAYEIQVVDEDDLALQTPISGNVWIHLDRRPVITAGVVNEIVTAGGSPVVLIGVQDDFGIGEIAMGIRVTRPAKQSDGSDSGPIQVCRIDIPISKRLSNRGSRSTENIVYPIGRDGESVNMFYRLNLSELKFKSQDGTETPLAEKDVLTLTLYAWDYRGMDETGKPILGLRGVSKTIVLKLGTQSEFMASIEKLNNDSWLRLAKIIEAELQTRGQDK